MSRISPLPSVRNVYRFRHAGPVVTHFDETGIKTADDLLTLVIRTDAQFATRDIQSAYRVGRFETTARRKNGMTHKEFSTLVEEAYKAWGQKVVYALSENLDYEGKYKLGQPDHHGTHIHFHSANSLSSAVIRKACALLSETQETPQAPLFISFDDMISEDIFRASGAPGNFKEIGFSRLFSQTGEELCFVGRPGHRSIESQIENVCKTLNEMGGDSPERVPIVILEDNVRRAKTLLWIIEKMEQAGVFKNGKMAAVATCFSVATPTERALIRHEDTEVPLIIGVDYTDSFVDVVTPRDHLFDGFVVQDKDGHYGRLPSFMLSDRKKFADNFKVKPDSVDAFLGQVIEANLAFCEEIENKVGVPLALGHITPGPTMAKTLDICPSTPMTKVLADIGKRRSRHLHPVQ